VYPDQTARAVGSADFGRPRKRSGGLNPPASITDGCRPQHRQAVVLTDVRHAQPRLGDAVRLNEPDPRSCSRNALLAVFELHGASTHEGNDRVSDPRFVEAQIQQDAKRRMTRDGTQEPPLEVRQATVTICQLALSSACSTIDGFVVEKCQRASVHLFFRSQVTESYRIEDGTPSACREGFASRCGRQATPFPNSESERTCRSSDKRFEPRPECEPSTRENPGARANVIVVSTACHAFG
jgi:hypothetical protein